jgi:hypothetical protein
MDLRRQSLRIFTQRFADFGFVNISKQLHAGFHTYTRRRDNQIACNAMDSDHRRDADLDIISCSRDSRELIAEHLCSTSQ